MKKSFLLPIVEHGCTRRAVLQGLGVAAAAALVPSCAQQGSDLPTAKSATCGSDVCIDLTVAANAPLATAGGAMLVDTSSDTIMVIRVSDTAVIALSAVCTHAGCTCNFDAASSRITCPCHGSVFDETGAVINGPARRPLKVYSATMSSNVITLTA
jgi:cytochrome b6-f complex iron-sulfur subunit